MIRTAGSAARFAITKFQHPARSAPWDHALALKLLLIPDIDEYGVGIGVLSSSFFE